MSSNFEQLQQRCKKLKLKERLRILAAVIIITAAALFVFFTATDNAPLSPQQPKIARSEAIKPIEKNPPLKAVPAVVQPAPSKEVSKKMHTHAEKPVTLPSKETLKKPPKSKLQSPDSSTALLLKEAEVKTIKSPIAKMEAVKVHKPAIHMELTDNTLENILEEYKKKPTYQRALNIADTYYDQENYNQCAIWAKKANLLKKDDVAAWIMFAKAEYAKGEKEKAIRILELFLNNKNSIEAESLLMTWQQKG